MIVVSLTSWPGAIEYAAGAVRSVLAGSVLPDRIVLYITKAQFGGQPLPAELLQLERDNAIFEIRDYPRDIRSYRKLVPALADFPEATIVTIDDDIAYGRHMLRRLLEMAVKFPGQIIAHRAKQVKLDKPYRKWPKYRWYDFVFRPVPQRFDTMQTGVGGVLYPPHVLKAEMLDPDLFMAISPTADDIWFWGAAVANGRKVIPVPFGQNKPRDLGKPRELSLKTVNFKSGIDRNREYFDAMLVRFPEIRQRLNDELRD